MHDGRAQEIGLGGYADNAKEPEKTNALWPARLESSVFKVIGIEPVAQIDVKAIRRVVRPLWHDKLETARRLFMAIAEVLDYGNGEGMCGPAPKLELVGKGLGAQPEPSNRTGGARCRGPGRCRQAVGQGSNRGPSVPTVCRFDRLQICRGTRCHLERD